MSNDSNLNEESIAKTKRRLFWYLLLVFALFGTILFYYFENVTLQENNVKINEANQNYVKELSALKNRSDARIDSLTNRIRSFEDDIDSLIASHTTASSEVLVVEQQIKAKKETLNNELERIENSKYIITNHSYKFPLAKRRAIGKYLKAQGYSNLEGWTYDQEVKRPSWMSLSPTVLYYSSKSEAKAKKIASDISKLTGYHFETGRGNGLGVIEGQEAVTFFIHSVGK